MTGLTNKTALNLFYFKILKQIACELCNSHAILISRLFQSDFKRRLKYCIYRLMDEVAEDSVE